MLWNLSSHDMLKEQLGREAVKPVTEAVLVPCSGITEGEDPKLELLADPEVFLNATGCLRCVCGGGHLILFIYVNVLTRISFLET